MSSESVRRPKHGFWEKAVFLVNTVGFVVYLAWLMTGSRRIFYTQDGVLYLLPCLPFFFVYAFLFGRRRSAAGETEDKHG